MRDRAYEMWRLRRCGKQDPWASNESSELATAAGWDASRKYWLDRVLAIVHENPQHDLKRKLIELKGADE